MIICSQCKTNLPASHFNRHSRDGYQQPCRDCNAKSRAKRRKTQADREARDRWNKSEAGKRANRRAVAKWEAKPESRARRRDWKKSHSENVRSHFTKWNRKQSHLRKLSKALRLIAVEALEQ